MSFFKALFKPKNNSNSPKIDKSSSSPNITEQQQDNKNYKSTSTYSPYTLQSQENNNQNEINNNSSSDEQHSSSFSSSFKLYPDYYHPGNEQQSSHNNESLMFMQSFASGFDIMGGSGVTPPSPTTNIKQYRSKRASSNGSTNSSGSNNNNTTPLGSSHPHYNTNSNNIGPIGASPRKANQLHPQSINVHYHYCGQCDSCLMAKYSKNPFTELTMLNQLDNRDDFNTSVNGNNNNASEFQNVVLLYDRNINLNWNYSKLIPHYLNYFNSVVSNNVTTPTPINTTPTKLNNHNSTFQNYLNTFNNYFYLNEEYLFYKSRETTTHHNNHQQNHMSCMIASGDYDGRIVLWDVAKGIKISTLKGHRLSVTCLSPIFLQVKKSNESRLQYSPFAQYLLTGSGDKSIKLWNISQIWEQSSNSLHNQHPMINISCERTMEGHKSSIRCIEVLQDGTPRFCSSANDGKICLWNWLTGELLQVIERDEGSIMNALSSSLFFTINNAIITKNPVSPILTRTLLITNSADKSSLYLYNIKENAEKDNNICEHSETHDENHLISHCFDDNLSFKSPILSVFKILNQSEGQVYNMNINSDTDSNNNVIYSCDHNFILSVATSDGEITLNRCYYKEGKWILKPIVTIQRAAKQNNKNDKAPKVYRHCYQMLINNSFLAVALDQDIFIFDISTAISQLVTSDSSEIICPTILEFGQL
ncbi:hypothetical protein ABK040_002588 [Willaertia magna]